MIWALLYLPLLLAAPAEFQDTAVIPSFRKVDPQVTHFKTYLRQPVDERLDLLLVRGGLRPSSKDFWWEKDLLGLFLQERDNPGRVYELTILRNEQVYCLLSVMKADTSELLLACRPEQGCCGLNHHFFFDTRSKSLLKHASYVPFAIRAVTYKQGAPQFIASDQKQSLQIRPGGDGLELLPGVSPASERPADPPIRFGPSKKFLMRRDEAKPWGAQRRVVEQTIGSKTKQHVLPQSNCREWPIARPRATINPCGEIAEEIGPAQVVGERLWFGKTFYDSEGMTGIGGFGYFDPADGAFKIFSPPEIADWSVSAILVEQDAVWLGLLYRGEYGGRPGGLLRWDSATRQITRIPVDSIVNCIARFNGRIYAGTEEGMAVLQDDRVRLYVVDQTLRGAWRITER